ncbi:MAG: hypothetical protein JW946_01990, partial [Candidatus Omnitrophica bacterium]|nr:hypothetical protein [Candidatus Omnitrophota bacterium]
AAAADNAAAATSIIDGISISDNYGVIKDKHADDKSDLTVILIQDLHCNYDAQMSIYKILNNLIKQNNINFVAIEGCVGRLDTAPFCNYPDEEIKDFVSKQFLKSGVINGAAYAHIMSKGSFAFRGADDRKLHKENLDVLRNSFTPKSENQAFCYNIRSILDEFKQKVYNRRLFDLEKQLKLYTEDKIPFSEFSVYLNNLIDEYKIDKTPYKNFNNLVAILALEKEIDFTAVDAQRAKCVETLSKRLKAKSPELKKLNDTSLSFKEAKISSAEFYSYLKDTAEQIKRIDFNKDYPELAKYINYILLYNDIDHMALFDEINQIQEAIKEKLFARDIERSIDKLSRNIEVFKSLAELKMTTRTLGYYRKHRSEFLASNFVNFITENAPKYKIKYTLDPAFRKVDAQLPQLEKFYALALERDKALLNNTISSMDEAKVKTSVLVAGGFHTDGITEMLKEKGISYLIITPKINELDEKNNPYTAMVIGKRTPFEELLYKQALKTKQENPEAYVFQTKAKYLADVNKSIKEQNRK